MSVSVAEASAEAGVGWNYTGGNIGASLAEAKVSYFDLDKHDTANIADNHLVDYLTTVVTRFCYFLKMVNK